MKVQTAVFALASILIGGASAVAATDLSDAQISAIMETANNGEISAGEMAKSKAQNKDVKNFAAEMVKEHTKNKSDGAALATKLNVKPEMNTTQAALKADAEKKSLELKAASAGKDFDKKYIESQVAMHETVLKELGGTLIPQADSAEMKSFLETTRTHVQHHLDQAKKIQTALNKL